MQCVCLSSCLHVYFFMHHSSVKGASSEDKDNARQALSSNSGDFYGSKRRWKCDH